MPLVRFLKGGMDDYMNAAGKLRNMLCASFFARYKPTFH